MNHLTELGGLKRLPGFTLVEIAVVLGILALILVMGLPFGIDTYRNYLLTSETRNLVSILRRAQEFAFSNKNESSYGLYAADGEFILFKGDSFAGRDAAFDEKYPREPSIAVSGFTEIVFSKLSGKPNVTSTINLSNGLTSQTVEINEEGVIFW